MINIKALRGQEVSEEVQTFMDAYGGSHVSLYEGWKIYPHLGTNPSMLGQELTCVLREGDKNLIKRILGRLRKMNAVAEDKIVKSMLDGESEPSPLGCLG